MANSEYLMKSRAPCPSRTQGVMGYLQLSRVRLMTTDGHSQLKSHSHCTDARTAAGVCRSLTKIRFRWRVLRGLVSFCNNTKK